MKATKIQKQIIIQVEEVLKIHVVDIQIPKQGMDGDVFLITDEQGSKYAIKVSVNAINDVLALNLIQERQLEIPVPKMFGHFSFENKIVLILERINFPLLESIPVDTQHLYISSMIANLKKIHTIKSNKAGLLNSHNKTMSWKDLLLFNYSGVHPWFNWNEIIYHDGVDAKLIQFSIKNISKKIQEYEFITNSYSLLHTDFNQRNLFINPISKKVAGIVDWGESMFGDPLYDFARIRMYIWHFNLKHKSLENYYKLLGLSEEAIKLEALYLVSQIIDYIAWYSESKNSFNHARMKLHQQFLREYEW